MAHVHSDHLAITLSVRIPPKIREQLEELADATGRTKSFLASEAIASYLITQAWQIKAIEKSLKKANNKKARFIDHSRVSEWLKSWGTAEERDAPK